MIWELVKERIYTAALGELGIYVVEEVKKCEGVFIGIGQLKQTTNISNRVKCSIDTA